MPATADTADKLSLAPGAGEAVRQPIPATRFGGQDPRPAELVVAPMTDRQTVCWQLRVAVGLEEPDPDGGRQPARGW